MFIELNCGSLRRPHLWIPYSKILDGNHHCLNQPSLPLSSLHAPMNQYFVQGSEKLYIPITFAIDTTEQAPVLLNERVLGPLLTAGIVKFNPRTKEAKMNGWSQLWGEENDSKPQQCKCLGIWCSVSIWPCIELWRLLLEWQAGAPNRDCLKPNKKWTLMAKPSFLHMTMLFMDFTQDWSKYQQVLSGL